MGQEEVLDILRKEKIATAEEIAEKTGIDVSGVRNNLNKLQDLNVEKIIIHTRQARMSYAWKIKGTKIPKEKLEQYNCKEG